MTGVTAQWMNAPWKNAQGSSGQGSSGQGSSGHTGRAGPAIQPQGGRGSERAH